MSRAPQYSFESKPLLRQIERVVAPLVRCRGSLICSFRGRIAHGGARSWWGYSSAFHHGLYPLSSVELRHPRPFPAILFCCTARCRWLKCRQFSSHHFLTNTVPNYRTPLLVGQWRCQPRPPKGVLANLASAKSSNGLIRTLQKQISEFVDDTDGQSFVEMEGIAIGYSATCAFSRLPELPK